MKKSRMVLWIIGGAVIAMTVAVVLLIFLNRSKDAAVFDTTAVGKLRVCHLEEPIGLDDKAPIFSWQMTSSERGSCQTAYRLTVAKSKEELEGGQFCWDSGEVFQSESVGISYEGIELAPKTRYYWRVQVTDQDGKVHDSQITCFETGLMGEGMSDAKWISAPEPVYEPTFTETAYDIQYSMEVGNTAASFVFGACEGRYGRMYLCEIENRDKTSFFRVKQLEDNKQTLIGETDISGFRLPDDKTRFAVELRVDGEQISAAVNGNEAGSFAIEETLPGSIGYFMGRGVSYAWLDDILVKDRAGNALYEEDFGKDKNIFEPYYVHTEGGRLRIGSGLMLTKGAQNPAPLFRKEFTLQDKEIASARVYMTALGCFDLTVNGKKTSQDYFSPGKLVYNQQLTYVTYDVTELLKAGEANAMGITLLHGWYDRAVGYVDIWSPWGDINALMGMLEVAYTDGSTDTIVTNQSFLCSLEGPVREDDIYQGEYYDANYEKTGFD